MTKAKRLHLYATIAWGIVLVLAGFGSILVLFDIKPNPFLVLLGVAFISLCSIYANMVGHWSAYQASRAEESNDK